jgi:hypothetical protein
MRYKGVRLHQSTFGPAVWLQITDASGTILFSDGIPLAGSSENDGLQRPEGEMELPDGQYSVVVLGSAVNGVDPYIGENQIGLEFYDAT